MTLRRGWAASAPLRSTTTRRPCRGASPLCCARGPCRSRCCGVASTSCGRPRRRRDPGILFGLHRRSTRHSSPGPAIFGPTASPSFCMILVLPWLVTMSAGRLQESSVVIVWAALCPLGSLLLEDAPDRLLWIVGFVAAPGRERAAAALSGAGGPARGLRHLVLRAQRRLASIAIVFGAPPLLRRPPQLLPGTLRDAAAQHPAEGNLRGAEGRAGARSPPTTTPPASCSPTSSSSRRWRRR